MSKKEFHALLEDGWKIVQSKYMNVENEKLLSDEFEMYRTRMTELIIMLFSEIGLSVYHNAREIYFCDEAYRVSKKMQSKGTLYSGIVDDYHLHMLTVLHPPITGKTTITEYTHDYQLRSIYK